MTDEERAEKARQRSKAYYAANREHCTTRQQAWVERNRERVRENQRRWAAENRERSRAIKKKWQDANREQVKEINQLYYQRNRERVSASAKRWREANPEKWALIIKANRHKREARKRGLPSYHITQKDLLRILSSPCAVPGCERTDIQLDHIIPISRGGSHGIGNLQPLCGSHNSSKHARLWIEFLRYLRWSTCETRTA